MTTADEFSEFHRRLDDFQSRLNQKTQQLEAGGSLSSAHREKISAMHKQSDTLRQKLQSAGRASWTAAKKELETEWHILTHAFDHWAEHVDKGFGTRDK